MQCYYNVIMTVEEAYFKILSCRTEIFDLLLNHIAKFMATIYPKSQELLGINKGLDKYSVCILVDLFLS